MSDFWSEVLTHIWWDWGIALNTQQAQIALQPETQVLLREEGWYSETQQRTKSDLAQWIVGVPWPEEEKVAEDPEYEEYLWEALYHLAEDKNLYIRT